MCWTREDEKARTGDIFQRDKDNIDKALHKANDMASKCVYYDNSGEGF